MQSDINMGVTVRNGKIVASVSGEGCEWVRILLRENNSEWQEHKLEHHPLFPTIFTGEFSYDGKKKYEYIFECDKGYFLDDHARLIKCNTKYGMLDTEYDRKSLKERNIFSDTLGKVCSVEAKEYDWRKDKRPFISTSDMIAYKLHVRGFTVHESSKIKHPGTYKGVSEKIAYLKNLGITTVILQPCNEFNELMDFHINIGAASVADVQRSRIFSQPSETIPKSRLNFWGYGAQGVYFAPKAHYASDPENACCEFKNMVRLLHTSGIEVILEMDYNSGCSDSFILENLRFWVSEYHIDGFRLNTDRVPMKLVATDAYLRNIKLICRDFSGEFLGRENVRNRIYISNDGFQDCIRRFLKGDEGQLVIASQFIKNNGGRYGQLNYIADHDGFTLNDVFSYDERHNEANGEGNRDGREANYSWNCGAEGPTKKHKIVELRSRMIKNAFTILMLSQGIPMIYAGDEFANTHGGNNNPYCCDNEQGWVIWNKTKKSAEIKDFVTSLIKLRKGHPVFRNDKILSGNDFEFTGSPDISYHGTKAWYPDFGYYSRTLGICLNGSYAKNEKGLADSGYILLINTHWEAHEFSLPVMNGAEWKFLLSTHPMYKGGEHKGREQRELVLPRTICIYELVEKREKTPDEKTDSNLSIQSGENNSSEGILESNNDAADNEPVNQPKCSQEKSRERGIRPDLDEETA